MMKKTLKVLLSLSFIIFLVFFFLFVFYLKGLPYFVSNQNFINFVQNTVNKTTGVNLKIENPVLRTDVLPDISLKVGKIELSKEEKNLLKLDNFKLEVSLKEVFHKSIILKTLVAQSIYADINSIEEIIQSKKKKKRKKTTILN